jgi:hypothetical protein
VSLLLAFAIAAQPPKLLVPGQSLGGIRIGDTPARVTQLWGRRHGLCRSCARLTWFYNERPFKPQGLAVTFRRGRVAAAYTIWQPPGWKTTRGVRTGDPSASMTAVYGALPRVACPGYDTYSLGPGTRIYVEDDRVWGFGLTRPGEPPCREARA